MDTLNQRQKIYKVIFGTSTQAGQNFDIALIIAILSSETILILSSITAIEMRFSETLFYAEWLFTLLFTGEYIARLYSSPKPVDYARSFYGIIDLLAIIPTYITFFIFIPGSNYLLIIRLIRVLRIFRILKLTRYLRDSNILLRSLKQAQHKILVFFSSVLILVIVFGSLMFVLEGADNGFSSIPQSIYWAIVTITTVGYGDMIPHTLMGKALASLTMLIGYSIIAVPTGIISAELSREMKMHREFIRCLNCSTSSHETDAEYCKKCGAKLPKPT